MDGKSKVKAYNRVSKGKSGYKVIRVNDFFRKKDDSKKDNTKRNLAIGAGLVVGAGIGASLLLKNKGTKNLLTPKTNIPTKQLANVVEESKVISPKPTLTTATKKEFSKIDDPWETPILTKIQKKNAVDMISTSKNTPLLTGRKVPPPRDNLYLIDNRASKRVTRKAASDAVRIGDMEKTYKSISPDNLAMRATVKIDHYLKRPRRTSNLGASPKPTTLQEVIDNPNIKKAQEKVTDRLSRAERRLLQKKARLAKKN